VVHRETVTSQGEGEGRIERVNPEDDTDVIFGAARVRVKTLPRATGVKVKNEAPPPSSDLPGPVRAKYGAAVKAAFEGLKEGVTTGPEGYPFEDLEATLLDVEPRDVKTDVGWRIAAQSALRKAIQNAGPAMLEPIMAVEVVVPEEFLGDVLGDLAARR